MQKDLLASKLIESDPGLSETARLSIKPCDMVNSRLDSSLLKLCDMVNS